MIKAPYSKQRTDYTCGPACLKMYFEFYGTMASERELAKLASSNESAGTRHKKMIEVARNHGFYCYIESAASTRKIRCFLHRGFPVIVHYKEHSKGEGHYSLVVGFTQGRFVLNDPWNGRHFKIKEDDFDKRWHDTQCGRRYDKWLLVLSPKKFNIGKQYSPKKKPMKSK